MILLKIVQTLGFLSQIALFAYAASECGLSNVELVIASLALVVALTVLSTLEKILSCLCSACSYTETYRNLMFLLTSTAAFVLSFWVAHNCDETTIFILIAYIITALATVAALSHRGTEV